jgi:hypothetical protein
MTTVQIKDRYLAQLYREAFSRHLEGQRLGMEEHRRALAWPSTSPSTVEGARGATSPLGGTAVPAKDPHR